MSELIVKIDETSAVINESTHRILSDAMDYCLNKNISIDPKHLKYLETTLYGIVTGETKKLKDFILKMLNQQSQGNQQQQQSQQQIPRTAKDLMKEMLESLSPNNIQLPKDSLARRMFGNWPEMTKGTFKETSNNIKTPEMQIDKNTSYYRRKLISILKDNTAFRPQRDLEEGVLSHKRLYKTAFSSRVFEKRKIDCKKKYNITLIIDTSGSMSGNRITMAAQSAASLVKLFTGVTEVSIIGYGGFLRTIKHNRRYSVKVFKDFKTKIKTKKDYDNLINQIITSCTGSTPQSDAMDFIKRDNFIIDKTKHILIDLSDGEPDNYPLTRELVRKADVSGILTFGIGIGTNMDYYKNNSEISDCKDIYPTMLKMLSKTIRRGE